MMRSPKECFTHTEIVRPGNQSSLDCFVRETREGSLSATLFVNVKTGGKVRTRAARGYR